MINKKLLKEDYVYIREQGPVSMWWLTDTAARAKRIEFLEKIGAIVRNKDDRRDWFPYCVYICFDAAFNKGVEGE